MSTQMATNDLLEFIQRSLNSLPADLKKTGEWLLYESSKQLIDAEEAE
jgi:hypothetical protein